MTDNKDTHEENKDSLDSKVDEALAVEEEIKEEAEDVKKKVKEVEEVKEDVKEESDEESEEESETEQESEEKVEEEPEEESEEEAPDPYKKKFIASSKEAQVLYAKNKKTNESLKEALSVKAPTTEELEVEYPDWDVMSDFEKKIAKNDLLNTRKLAAIDKIAIENESVVEWNSEVDKFMDDPQTLIDSPKLEGKVEEFKLFATKPTRRNVDFEDLVSAFLYEEKTTRKPKKKGRMFPTGTGGAKTKGAKDGKISIEDAAVLKKNDYPKWKQMLAEDKIDFDI